MRRWVEDGLYEDDILTAVAAEMPGPDHPSWARFDNELELKLMGGRPLWGPQTRQLAATLETAEFADYLTELTGIPDLICSFEGGGYHRIERGGKLGIHVDFNRSSDGLYRRLNVLTFLNADWDESWGGNLLLCDEHGRTVESIVPYMNRTVIFETTETSYHGHPTPLACPEGVARKSFAAYFFTAEPPEGAAECHSTVFAS